MSQGGVSRGHSNGLCRVYTTDQQIKCIDEVAARLVEDENRYRVLIVDSVMSIFRSEFQGRGELAERQQTLGRHLNHLTKDEYTCVHTPIRSARATHLGTYRLRLHWQKSSTWLSLL